MAPLTDLTSQMTLITMRQTFEMKLILLTLLAQENPPDETKRQGTTVLDQFKTVTFNYISQTMGNSALSVACMNECVDEDQKYRTERRNALAFGCAKHEERPDTPFPLVGDDTLHPLYGLDADAKRIICALPNLSPSLDTPVNTDSLDLEQPVVSPPKMFNDEHAKAAWTHQRIETLEFEMKLELAWLRQDRLRAAVSSGSFPDTEAITPCYDDEEQNQMREEMFRLSMS